MTRTALLIGAGYGAYFLYAYASGALYFYIHPVYVIPVVVTGVILLALTLIAGAPRRATSPGAAHAPAGVPEHARGGRSTVTVALLVLPLALGFLLPPKPLGLATAAQRGVDALLLGRVDDPPEFRVEQRPETYTIKDWVKAMQADPEPSRHAGKPVQVTGFVYRNDRLPGDWFLVARFVVQCCAVDATPIGLPVRAPEGKVPEAGGWVSIEGTWEVAEVRGERKAVIALTTVTPTKRPEQPYLY